MDAEQSVAYGLADHVLEAMPETGTHCPATGEVDATMHAANDKPAHGVPVGRCALRAVSRVAAGVLLAALVAGCEQNGGV